MLLNLICFVYCIPCSPMFNWGLTSYLLKVLVRLQEWLQMSGVFLMIMKQNCKCWRSETRTILNLIYLALISFGPFFFSFYICLCLRQPTCISTFINFMDQLPILQLFLVFLFNMLRISSRSITFLCCVRVCVGWKNLTLCSKLSYQRSTEISA